jgi:hypothetical protein
MSMTRDELEAEEEQEGKAAKIRHEVVLRLVQTGLASWSGGKPRGSAEPVRLKGGKSAAEIVLEDRR